MKKKATVQLCFNRLSYCVPTPAPCLFLNKTADLPLFLLANRILALLQNSPPGKVTALWFFPGREDWKHIRTNPHAIIVIPRLTN